MRRIERTAQFRRDYKRERRGRNHDALDTVLIEVLKSLAEDRPLAERHQCG
jgi:mRNA interferase YafQ